MIAANNHEIPRILPKRPRTRPPAHAAGIVIAACGAPVHAMWVPNAVQSVISLPHEAAQPRPSR